MMPALLDVSSVRIEAAGRDLLGTLDFRVQAGERWCVLGPNGAGKTRLIETLAGLRAPAAGAIHYQGQALAGLAPLAAARLRALLPQHWHDAFDATVFELACSGRHPHLRGDGWEDSADFAVVAAMLARFALDGLMARHVNGLSGGERQRLALATALVQQTPLLLLDEPLNHLDPYQARAVLATVLRSVEEGAVGLLCSLHDLTLAQAMATHVILLDGRGSHRCGPVDVVMCPDHLRAAYGIDFSCLRHQGQWHWLPAGQL
ncbi:MAG: ABC transporter ATP-binding protein [Pseudomonadota bacterium]|nr:ABC transporter ATP-binding protein [Pseudomonadota bacterium]